MIRQKLNKISKHSKSKILTLKANKETKKKIEIPQSMRKQDTKTSRQSTKDFNL